MHDSATGRGSAEKIWQVDAAGLEDYPRLAERVLADIWPESMRQAPALQGDAELKFSLALSGDLGAGKTTFTKYLLWGLGLSKDTPVTSPTFTYVNEYAVGPYWFAHLDLYRLDEGGQAYLEDFGFLDVHPPTGLMIEWSDRLAADSEQSPTHELCLETFGVGRDSSERRLSLWRKVGA